MSNKNTHLYYRPFGHKLHNIILKIAIPSPIRQCFDYLVPEELHNQRLRPGQRLQVPFGRRQIVGMLVGHANQSAVPLAKLKPISSLLDPNWTLDPIILKMLQWASDYYQHPLGEVIFAALPNHLRRDKPIKFADVEKISLQSQATLAHLTLNEHQQLAFDQITQTTNFQPFLLDGITGSGKTEIYLQCTEQVLQKQQQVLILVPEISLTPQTLVRFQQRFSDAIVPIHSGLTDSKRLKHWLQAQSGEAKIVIGTRSAIFTPMPSLGLIIIDEEHDASFKQHSGFRYSARDLAMVRSQIQNCPIILGSATPSIESLYNVQRKRYHYLHLPVRAGNAKPPTFHIIDLRNKKLKHGISEPLLKEISNHLEQKNQVLIFLNRRGFAPALLCHKCGWTADCKRCATKMTLHNNPKRLICHHCTSIRQPDSICAACGSSQLMHVGLGTERLEYMLEKQFPDANLVRIDRDTTRRKGSLQEKLADIESGKSQILIGTQMLTKGHHFPNVTLVAIVDADSGLYCGDFRASERMAQILIQVAGRAGREQKTGHVYIQTHFPEHPLFQELIQHGYNKAAERLLKERRLAKLPPFTSHALLRAESVKQEQLFTFLDAIREKAELTLPETIKLLGPIPAPLERKKNRYRGQLLIQSKHRSILQKWLPKLINMIEDLKVSRAVHWTLDVDPLDMM